MWSAYRDHPPRRLDTTSTSATTATTATTSTASGSGNTAAATTPTTRMKLTKAPPATHAYAHGNTTNTNNMNMNANKKTLDKGKDPIRPSSAVAAAAAAVSDSQSTHSSSFLRDRDRDRDVRATGSSGSGSQQVPYGGIGTRARRPSTADGGSNNSWTTSTSASHASHSVSQTSSQQQQQQSQPRSRNRGSLFVAAASDAFSFSLFGGKRRSPSVRSSPHKHPFAASSSPAGSSSSFAAQPQAYMDVIEISAPRRDAEDEERDRLREMAAQAIGLDPYVDVGRRTGIGGGGVSPADEEEEEEEEEEIVGDGERGGVQQYEYDTIRGSEAKRHQMGASSTATTGAALGGGGGGLRGLSESASTSTSNNTHMGISAPLRRSPHGSSLSVTIPLSPHNHNHQNHNYNQNQTYAPASSRLSHTPQPPHTQAQQQSQPQLAPNNNNSNNNSNNNNSRLRSSSIMSAGGAAQRGHSPSNSMTMAPIPPYPCTVSSLTPFRDSAAIYPKYYPPSSLRIFALSKNWKNRFVILSSPATLITKGSLPAVSYLHLFKGQGAEEKELERLEINEDSVVFVEEQEVGGKRRVIKVGGADVGARRREWVVEEGGHVMWLLQIVDQAEAQRWITSIKNAILGQRTVRAGLIPPLSLGNNNEPRGDMDVMLSIRAATSSYKNNVNSNSITTTSTTTPTSTHTNNAHTNAYNTTNTSGHYNTGSSPPNEIVQPQPHYASSISSHSIRSQSTTHPQHAASSAINAPTPSHINTAAVNSNTSNNLNTPTTATNTPSKPPASPTSAVFAPLKGLFTNRPRSTSRATSVSSTSSFRAMLSSTAADDNTSVSNYSYYSSHTPGVNGDGGGQGQGQVGGGFSFASRGSNLLSMLRSSPSPGPGNVTSDTQSIHTIHSQSGVHGGGSGTPRPTLLPFGVSMSTGKENATRLDRKIIQDHHQHQQPYSSSWSASASHSGSSSTVYHPHAPGTSTGVGVEVGSRVGLDVEEDTDILGSTSIASGGLDGAAGTGMGGGTIKQTKERSNRGLSLGAAMSLQPPPRKRWTSSGIVDGSANSTTVAAGAGMVVDAGVGGGSGSGAGDGGGQRKAESVRRVSFSPSRASVEYDRAGGGSGGSSGGNGAGGVGEDALAGFQFGTPELRPRAPSIQSVSTYASGSAEYSNAQSYNSASNNSHSNTNGNNNGNANANGNVERSSTSTKRSSRTSARRWSRQGQGMGGLLPTRLTPPSEPPPAVPALDVSRINGGSAHGRGGSGHPYANAGNANGDGTGNGNVSGNGSAQSSEKSLVSSLPAFSKRASAGSTYSASTTYSHAMSVASSIVSPSSVVTNHSPHSAVGGGPGSVTGSPSHQRHSPSSHRASMPPPPRPAPTSALPPAPMLASASASASVSATVTAGGFGGGDIHHQDALAALEGNHNNSAGKAPSSSSSPASATAGSTSSSFRNSLAHRPFRLSLAQAPKPPPMATLPPRPDEVEHNNPTGANQSNAHPPTTISPSEKKKSHRRTSSGGISGSMINSSTKLEPIPASPVPAAKSLASSPFPPPVGPLPPTPPSTSSTSGTVSGTLNDMVPPQQSDPAVQAVVPKRAISFTRRLRNLSNPQPVSPQARAPQPRARSHTNQHNTTTMMTNSTHAHVYAYSPPPTPIAEKITLFQNDPSFLQMHTPVLSSPPPPTFVVAATASAQHHREQEAVDGQLDGMVSLLPPPRRGSKQLLETDLPSTSASASATTLASAPEVEALPSETEPAPRVLGMKLSIVGGGSGIPRSSNAPLGHLSLSRPGSALSNHSHQSDTFLEIDWEPSPKDEATPRDEYPPMQQHEKHQPNIEPHRISLSRPGSVVSLEVMAV